MRAIKASTIYLRHPKVFSILGVVGAIGGAIQDVFIQYASFGNVIALGSIAIFFLISAASALKLDSKLRETIGNDWPGIGLAATALFAILMGGAYFWSNNNQNSGGVLATHFEGAEKLQSGIDAMMREMGIVRRKLDVLNERTARIEQDTKQILNTSERIEVTTSDIRNRIETDPETILKDFNLTLDGEGYGKLLSRDYDKETLAPLLQIYADYGLTLDSSASSVSGLERVEFSVTKINLWSFMPSVFTVIGAKLVLGDVDSPNLRKALEWEFAAGIREPSETKAVSFDIAAASRVKNCSPRSCFSDHLLKHRKQKTPTKTGEFALAHWAALGGKEGSFEFLAAENIPLNPRTTPGYSPFDIAVQVGNLDVASWLIKELNGDLNDKEGISYEILALKAVEGIDTRITQHSYAPGVLNIDNWYSNFRSRIHKHQELMKLLSHPEDLSSVNKRVIALIEPYERLCWSAIAEGEKHLSVYAGVSDTGSNPMNSLVDLKDLRTTCQILENHLRFVASN